MVQFDAPRASVKPVGAEPNFEMLPRAEVAIAVPVPDVVPPADSMVRLIELAMVPVTVSVPSAVSARAGNDAEAKMPPMTVARSAFFMVFLFPGGEAELASPSWPRHE